MRLNTMGADVEAIFYILIVEKKGWRFQVSVRD